MWFVGIFVIGHDARLEVLICVPFLAILEIPALTVVYESPIAQVISTSLICLPLRPGHHQETEATAQRQAQDERQSRPENSQKRRQTHAGDES